MDPREPSFPDIPLRKGASYACWRHSCDEAGFMATALARLRADGANAVAVVVTGYMASREASAVGRTERTATDDFVRAVIREAKGLGLAVLLKPHVDVEDGSYRGEIRPADEAAWFDSYGSFLLPYAEIAAEEGVEELAVGTELVSLSGRVEAFRDLIASARAVFPGRLTYAANFDEVHAVPFWDSLDAIGVDAYWPLAETDDPDPLVLRAALLRRMLEVRPLAERHGKPLLLTEVGYTSRDGTARRPWDLHVSDRPDPFEQADCYEAVLAGTANAPWIRGLWFWRWNEDPHQAPANLDYTPCGKPAEEVLVRYWTE